MRVLIFFFLLFSFCKNIFAVQVEEIQELRLAKAELAYSDGDEQQALKFIQENLILKHFHPESYLFLIKVHRDGKRFVKAIKVGQFIIKKMNVKEILVITSFDNLGDQLSELLEPNDSLQSLYFQMGQIYFDMYQSDIYSRDTKARILFSAEKYFRICLYYKFAPAQANLFLGMIKREKEDHAAAIDHLMDAKELLDEEGDNDKTIDYLLGDSLVREGYSDAGSIYLRSVQNSLYANDSLRNYAKNYLDSIYMSNRYFSMGLGYGFKYDDNVNSFYNSQLSNFNTSYKTNYISKDATLLGKNVDLYYSNQFNSFWSCAFSGGVAEESAVDRRLYFVDTRVWNGQFDLKYFNLIKSQLKVSYGISQAYNKELGNIKFVKGYTNHSFQIQYTHILKRGAISYAIPFSFSTDRNYGNLNEKGMSISYQPFRYNKLFLPTYAFKIKQPQEREINRSHSTQWQLGINNYTLISKKISFFTMFYLLSNLNSSDQYSYNEFYASGYMSIIMPFTERLMMNLSISKQYRDYANGEKMRDLEFNSKLSFLFD